MNKPSTSRSGFLHTADFVRSHKHPRSYERGFVVIKKLSLLLIIASFAFIFSFIKRPPDHVASVVTDLSGEVDPGAVTGVFEGNKVTSPLLAESKGENHVLGAQAQERWIEVDLSEQRLKAWEGNNLFLETLVSTGLPWWATPTGEFRIWTKLRATRMEGGEGRYYYNLPNVPYVMFFENEKVPSWRGFGLHGTYWHNSFGTQRSHGCVNLPTPMAEKLYYWTSPVLADGSTYVRATSENMGTRIVIHD